MAAPLMHNLPAAGALQARLEKSFHSSEAPGFHLDVTFSVPRGVTILFGPSGSGKTTILECLAGLLEPDAGRVSVAVKVLFDSEAGVALPPGRRGVGYVFQNLALFPHLSVEENVGYGLAEVSRAAREGHVRGILENFRIDSLARRRPDEISGGQRQRTALARSLVADPCLLLLDEPLAALDLPVKSQIIEDLKSWNERHGIPILCVTHSHREVFALGERVIVLDDGRIAAQGTPQEVLREPRQEAVAQLAGFENIFDATVAELRESQGTMRCRLDGSDVMLEAPIGKMTAGDCLRIAIRGGDILLATARPEKISARNILPGRILELHNRGARVEARVACGVEFVAELTLGSCETLELARGSAVWLIIKTHSCHLLES
ncbi:MAG: molybdenum ABC transporter ATP-binding protein [Candidatus Acidiferrales bacterium]